MEFPGQGLSWSHSSNLSHSCGKARSLTHGAGLGVEPVSQYSQDDTDPIEP